MKILVTALLLGMITLTACSNSFESCQDACVGLQSKQLMGQIDSCRIYQERYGGRICASLRQPDGQECIDYFRDCQNHLDALATNVSTKCFNECRQTK